MDSKKILAAFDAQRNETEAIKMAKYMRNQFPFFGIHPP